MKRINILTITLLFICEISIGQISGLPNIIPPNPEATNFNRYTEIPVDYSTGVPEISIPLFALEGRKLKVPISISYHSGGIKVEDRASTVGLGWVLNAGGMINRTVLGVDDLYGGPSTIEGQYGYIKTTDAINNLSEYTSYNRFAGCLPSETQSNVLNQKKEVLYYMATGHLDSQSDRYNYSYPGGSGIFRYDFQTGLPVTIPYKPIKIERFGSCGLSNCYFKITDVDGNIYIYKKWDTTQSTGIPLKYSNVHLSCIISPDLSDTIEFKYNTNEVIGVSTPSDVFHNGCTHILGDCSFYVDSYYCNSYLGEGDDVTRDRLHTYTTDNISLLTTIKSSKGEINFEYADQVEIGRKRLAKILVKNLKNEQIRCVNLTNNQYFGTSQDRNQRLKLASVEFTNIGNPTPEIYSFQYNSTVLPSYYDPNDNSYSCNDDYWGYYNHRQQFTSLPGEFFPTGGQTNGTANLYKGNRNPDENYMKACIIEKITYPTGGWTEYEFEAHRGVNVVPYGSIPDNTIIGGLRIKQIRNYSKTGATPEIKTYKYGHFEDGYASDYVHLNRYYFNEQKTALYFAKGFSGPPPAVGCGLLCLSASANYNYLYGTTFLSLTLGNQSTVMYDYITEYYGNNTTNIGKKIYHYASPPNNDIENETLDNPSPSELSSFIWDKGAYIPLLLNEEVYRYEESSPFKIVSNEYSDFKSESHNMGIHVKCNAIIALSYDGLSDKYILDSGDYFYTNTFAYTITKLITKQTEVVDGVSTEKQYEYNNVIHLLPTSKKSTTSNIGGELITLLKYPHDFLPSEPYQTMVNKHLYTPVIEEINNNETTFLESTKTDYSFWNNNITIAPITVQTKQGINAYETRLRYHSYDKHENITSVSKENDIKTIYIWSYNQTYPVVKGYNVTYDILNTAVNTTVSDAGATNLETYWSGFNDIATNTAQQTAWKNFNTTLRSNASLANAQISTYTYKPLIGLTSQTDPNGKTTYYEYDTFGRLKLIRDDQNNILKKFDYHYSTQN